MGFNSGFKGLNKYIGHFPSPQCVRLQYIPVKQFFLFYNTDRTEQTARTFWNSWHACYCVMPLYLVFVMPKIISLSSCLKTSDRQDVGFDRWLSGLYLYSKTNQMHNKYLKFILFWNNTLPVSDGLFVHHQETKTVDTTSGICHTGSVVAC